MKANDIIGMNVIDEEDNYIGTVEDMSIDKNNGSIEKVNIILDQGLFSNKKTISFDQVNEISDDMTIFSIIDIY
ncbi:PRC-barrel domain protein [Methanobrevibacter cuticularis]|uniref:PRC-barrel domain protein n=1 Tax=Methanobrevibacter cuticularis TaxID=47311 RepID=A0A166FGR9_9EURY|nr:PRC-barrel domain-containing protein [Methanobrevibacter cuticularis]KZX17655.1 PRC-barrel domain protein [Methanobrevibacter cuticularis]